MRERRGTGSTRAGAPRFLCRDSGGDWLACPRAGEHGSVRAGTGCLWQVLCKVEEFMALAPVRRWLAATRSGWQQAVRRNVRHHLSLRVGPRAWLRLRSRAAGPVSGRKSKPADGVDELPIPGFQLPRPGGAGRLVFGARFGYASCPPKWLSVQWIRAVAGAALVIRD